MFNKLKTMKPSSIVALLLFFVGVLLFAIEFSNQLGWINFEFSPEVYWWGSSSPFVWLLSIILIFVGIYFLNKNKEIIINKKSIINIIILLLTFCGGVHLIKVIIWELSLLESPPFIVSVLFPELVGLRGWRIPLSELLFIGGLIYLIRANRKPEEKVLLEEELQQEEEENPVAQGKNQLSVGQWFWTIFLLGIPLVNLILLLVWGFGAPNPRKNFSLACLLYMLIGIIIAILVAVIAGISGATNY